MPIPAFDVSGVLPPYAVLSGGGVQLLSPYVATPTEVVVALGNSPNRQAILAGWLAHRSQVRNLGFASGFQWLDGSFVEDKNPNDLDVVTFLRRPAIAPTPQQLGILLQQNQSIFNRAAVKAAHRLDAFFVDMDGSIQTVIDLTRYWTGLFSHRRGDFLWKGMVQVDLGTANDDAIAMAQLSLMAALPFGVSP